MIFDISQKEQIYKDYYNKVNSYVRYKIASGSDVDDVVSDVFLKVYSKIDTFDENKSSLSTWIYHITQNTIIDYYRKRKVFVEIPESLSIQEDDELINEDSLNKLVDGLQELDDKERRVIILHYYEDMKLKDIADKMNLSYIYVKVLHKKALMKLKKFVN